MTNVGLVYELYDSFIEFPLFIVIIFEIYILIGKKNGAISSYCTVYRQNMNVSCSES